MKKSNKGKTMTVVIGASRLGAAIASMSSMDGIYTSIIDINEESFRKLDSGYSGYTVCGNAEDTNVLKKAHIDEARECVIATSNDNTNILLACLITGLYKVPYVIVRLRDERKAALLSDPRIKVISTAMLSLQAYKSIKSIEE
ncbi:MAG: NAD-binding protein [Bacilli bacterium]|nr:NAD-binding protein [Bacilli bacterium]